MHENNRIVRQNNVRWTWSCVTHTVPIMFFFAAGIISLGVWQGWKGEASSAASDVMTSDTIKVQRVEGKELQPLTFPLYQIGEVQYFSAGVGIEEREATYPPFSLKLVFVAETRAFLTGVSVTIRNDQGDDVLQVPANQVLGPWLFVNIPAGNYEVTATRSNNEQVKRTIRIEGKGTKVVHFHWPPT